MLQARKKRKEVLGVVISDKMDKTITVQTERITRDKYLNKTVKAYTKFKVHDEKDEAKVGDRVRISETRPLSKTKSWRLVEILKK